ncbi:endolysin [Alteromonas phage vB_AmeM_PT11-V22]|uniref:Dit-like phage tail protein N-terminal domain-containing protein n=1 Tax=Alteromonas phage vB_AmeM_PT11-V22 TaxID=2704031 RepID=A0A6C0R0G1_9CAUD|nr:endolysin [Alteromonas phage vB_AmeM_PT11-V22]QHZ59741.1 hypothetical protein [Alteromonas phage vB_AmeM_PT11-V22]
MASEIFLIHQPEAGGLVEYFELTCTTDITVEKRSTVTDVPVEAGFSVADNAFAEPTRFSIKGVLTNIVNVSLDYYKSPEETIKSLHSLMDQGTLFTLSADNTLDSYDDVVIESMSIVKSRGMGTSWNADISMKQVGVTNKARNVTFPPQQPDTEKQSSAKRKQSSNNTEEKELEFTTFVEGGKALVESSFFYGIINATVGGE